MEMLFKARGTEPLTIHLTYPIPDIDAQRKAEWEKQQEQEKKTRKKNKRPNWSPAQQSLAAFFDKHKPAARQKIVVVGDHAPHVIDLLDPLGA
jgi:hypothetical protein